jgi:NodT family efflux transporter outer membrane factor (OMF) lipoprotein
VILRRFHLAFRAWRGWSIGLTLSLTACSLGPRYTRPEVPTPPTWRSVEPEQAQATGWPAKDWWRGFQAPQLDALISQAEKANDDIGAAIARVREADAQVRIAGAPLLPSLSLGADGSRQRQRSASLGGAASATGGSSSSPTVSAASAGATPVTYNTFATELGVSYELDFWGRNRAVRNAAEFTAQASRYDRATVELTVVTSVASTWFQTLELRDRLKVAQENLGAARTILDGLKLEAKVGTATALDVAQQEETVAALTAAIPPLQQQLLQTTDALAILVGQTPETLQIASGTLAEITAPPVQPGLPSELLARRPDIAQAEAQLMSANANIAAARAAFFPSIQLTGDGGFASTALSTLFNPVSRVWSATAGLTQPIFQGGALTGQYAYNKARYDELVSTYHKAVISAFSNVEDALVAVQQTGEQQRRQEEVVATARRAYEFSQTQFHAGVINIVTVLNTENALFTAQDTLVQVKYSHLNALVTLYGALGGGWQRGSDS